MKTILLTGATDGIGLETAKMLVEAGHSLLLHGRSKERLEATKKILLELNPSAQLTLVMGDFSSMDSVNAMAEEILQSGVVLDAIINNAGVYVVEDKDVVTADGLDVRIAVNTVAPYVLTRKLLPLLSAKSRVVNVASAAQMPIHFPALYNQVSMNADEAYAHSKMALIAWTMELAEQEAPLFVSVNPKSFLGSKMVRVAYNREGFDLKLGADILYRATLSEEFDNANGAYYCNDNKVFANPHPFVSDVENRKKVMEFLGKYA